MTKADFEHLLDVCCGTLTHEARREVFKTAQQFENRVREVLDDLLRDECGLHVDFSPPPQAFPDIALGEYGVEVKFTLADTWKSIANSIQESQRVQDVRYIYIVFGKMGGKPEVRWGSYEQSVVHVRTSHVPRFEVEMPAQGMNGRTSLFDLMGVSYEDFSRMDIHEKMRHVRAYAKKIHPNERLWWMGEDEEHSLPINIRLYTNLSPEEKARFRAEALLLCPDILKSGRTRNKYDDAVMFLLSYHGVLCHQARDMFSAGSVANPDNDDKGGLYIERAVKLLESDLKEAARTMDGALFREYWGQDVPPEDRIGEWLKKADRVARGWTPSKTLFGGEYARCCRGVRNDE